MCAPCSESPHLSFKGPGAGLSSENQQGSEMSGNLSKSSSSQGWAQFPVSADAEASEKG